VPGRLPEPRSLAEEVLLQVEQGTVARLHPAAMRVADPVRPLDALRVVRPQRSGQASLHPGRSAGRRTAQARLVSCTLLDVSALAVPWRIQRSGCAGGGNDENAAGAAISPGSVDHRL